METLTDPRPLFHTALTTATALVAAVRPDQLDRPTPCDEYDVRGLLVHLVDVLDRIIRVGRGDDAFAASDRVVVDDAWLAAWQDATTTLEATWADDASLGRPSPLPWAPGTTADALAMWVTEVTVHTWDLGQAIGMAPAWDAEVLDHVAQGIGVGLPATGRSAVFGPLKAGLPPHLAALPDPFQDAVPVPDDAPIIARLVAWNGRQP